MSVFCKICNGYDVKEKWPTVYNKNIKLFYCNDCNHGFLNPYFSKDELNDFYKNDYRKIFVFNIPYKKTVKSVKQMMEDTGQLNETNLRANMIIQKDDNKLNVLDIGSGTGMFLNCCYNINQNLKLYGIEPDDDHKYLSSNSDKFLIFNNLDEVKKLNVIFDKVTIFHTFEHIENLADFLNNLKQIINEKTEIYIEVPNGEYNWVKKSFVHLAHPQIFSKLSITKVLNLNNYKILSYDRYDERTDYLILKVKFENQKQDQYLKLKNNKLLESIIDNAKWGIIDAFFKFIKDKLILVIPAKYLGVLSRLKYKYKR